MALHEILPFQRQIYSNKFLDDKYLCNTIILIRILPAYNDNITELTTMHHSLCYAQRLGNDLTHVSNITVCVQTKT
jgi:hypothetical protein